MFWPNFIVTHIHRHTTILRLSGFCPEQPGWAVPEETCTHSHLSWSSVIPYLLPPSTTFHNPWHPHSSPFNSRARQPLSTICLQVLPGPSPRLAPSTPYSIHFFTQPSSSSHSTHPHHCNLHRDHAIQSQSLPQSPPGTPSCSPMWHIHPTTPIPVTDLKQNCTKSAHFQIDLFVQCLTRLMCF